MDADSIDVLPIIVVVFAVLGLTGNAIFLSAVIRDKKLRTKHGDHFGYIYYFLTQNIPLHLFYARFQVFYSQSPL